MELTVKHYVNCLKFLVGLMLFAIYINSILYDGNPNINFMYVASPPRKGLLYPPHPAQCERETGIQMRQWPPPK